MFVLDKLYDFTLFALLSVITAHSATEEGTNYIYYGIFFIYIALAAFRAFMRGYLNFKHFKIPVHTLWYGVFIIFCLMSVLWAKYPESVFHMMSRLTQNLILAYFMIINVETREDFRRVQNIFILSSVYLGLRILVSVPTSEIFSSFLGSEDITGHNVNSVAFYYAITLIILIDRIYSERQLRSLIPFAFIGFMLLLTSSRKAVLMVILAVFLTIFLDRGKKHKFLKLFGAALIIAVIIYIVFTNDNLYHAIGRRFDSMLSFLENTKVDKSLSERRFFRKYALELFYRNAFVGVGLNNFSNYLGNVFTRSTYAHNNWLEILSCLGIVGFVTYYWFYAYLVLKFRRQLKCAVKYVSPFLTMIICIFFSEYAMVVYSDTFIQMSIALCFIGVSVADSELKSKLINGMGGNQLG